jgi:RimJ/RimL family protein N-acetyltransferase
VREASFDTNPIPLELHRRWFGERLDDASTRLSLVVDSTGTAVGFVRLDIEGGGAEIAVALSAAARGRGLGRFAIRKVCLEALAERPALEQIVARVKPSNEGSLRAFHAAGFRDRGKGDGAVELVFSRDEA